MENKAKQERENLRGKEESMLQGIDLNQVKQYNASLKQYRDAAANINAQIQITQADLNKLCKELSAELGVEVTEDNVEQIYNSEVDKINSTLKSGNAVLAKIAEEEQRLNNPQPQSQPQAAQPSASQVKSPSFIAPPISDPNVTTPPPEPPKFTPQSMDGMMNIPTAFSSGAVQQTASPQSKAGSVFGGAQASSPEPMMSNMGQPLFKLG